MLGENFNQLQTATKVVSAHLPMPGPECGEPLVMPIYTTSVYRNTSTQNYTDILTQAAMTFAKVTLSLNFRKATSINASAILPWKRRS